MFAAWAAFRVGRDDLVDAILGDLMRRFPHAASVYELRSDLSAYRGEYADALRDAEHARLLEPSRPAAVSRVVRMSYAARGEEFADDVSIAALRRFPLSQSVLWAVGKGCSSTPQAHRVLKTWRDAVQDERELPRVVRQLANAAVRGRLADEASQLYRDAIVAVNAGVRTTVATRVLEGKGAWAAIEDLADVLDSARVPFFFAAGTALGLVREGRPLALDGDIDVGVFDADFDRESLCELFRTDSRFLLDLNPMSEKVGLKHRGGSPIDVFRYFERDGKIWHDGVFVRWDNSPFEVVRREVNGLSVPLPADADTYLTENYGDWRMPNPAYDVFTEAPNCYVHWPEYAHMHLLREAFKALSAGELDVARGRLEGAGETELVALLRQPESSDGFARAGLDDTGAEATVRTADRNGTDSDDVERLSVDKLIERARTLAVDGDSGTAMAEIEAAIRDGRAEQTRLWVELASLVEDADDYEVVRRLWLDSSIKKHDVSLVRSVARAAMVAGDHQTATLLLRKAIVAASHQSRRPLAGAWRMFGWAESRVPLVGRASGTSDLNEPIDPEANGTLAYVALLDAVTARNRHDVRRLVTQLRSQGEQLWLEHVI